MFDPFSPEHRQPRFGLWEFLLGVLVGASLVGGASYFAFLNYARQQFEATMQERVAAEAARTQAQAAVAKIGPVMTQAAIESQVRRAGDNLVDDICESRWQEIYFRGTSGFPPEATAEEFAQRMNWLELPRTDPRQRSARKSSLLHHADGTVTFSANASPGSGAAPIHVDARFIQVEGEWLIQELDVTQDK